MGADLYAHHRQKEVSMALPTRGQKGVTIHDRSRAWAGYTLFVQTHEGVGLGRDLWAYPRLIDMEGTVIYEWRVGTAVQLVKLQADGSLYYMTRDRSNIDEAGLYRLAPDSTVLWHYHCRIDHDYYPLASGNILIHTITDNMTPVLGNELRRHPYLLEITPEKELVWEWKGEEHIQELIDLGVLSWPIDWEGRCREEIAMRSRWDAGLRDLTPAQQEAAVQRQIRTFSFDWAHNNTCQVIEENEAASRDGRFRPGNIIFSYRTLDIIGVIDRESGEIVWAWGPGSIDGQHKPHMLPDGRILIFDNGTRRGWSRVIELDPFTEEIVWEYRGDPPESFFSPAISGAQRLPNGNTLICEGGPGHHTFGGVGRLFEVTREGEIVWEFRTPYRGFIHGREGYSIYRANRYSADYCRALLEG
jgi:hypothetical protein